MNSNERIRNLIDLGNQRKKRRLDLQRTKYANRVKFGEQVASRFINDSLTDFTDDQGDELVDDDLSCIVLDDFYSTSLSTVQGLRETFEQKLQRNDVQDDSLSEKFHSSNSEKIDEYGKFSSDDASYSSEQCDEPPDSSEQGSIGMLKTINTK